MQAHPPGETPDPRDRWPIYNVDYRIRVRVADKAVNPLAFFDAICGGETSGPGWELIEDLGIQTVEVVNPEATFGDQAFIKVTRGVYDQDAGTGV